MRNIAVARFAAVGQRRTGMADYASLIHRARWGHRPMRRIVGGCAGAAFAAVGLLSTPALAQFPPQGFTANPDNPALATRRISKSVKGIGKLALGPSEYYIEVTVYYDCSKKRWVVTAVSSNIPANHPEIPISSKVGQEYSSGPPPGSTREPGDPNRAFNPTTGQNFVHHKGQWIDVKNGQVIPEPKLCPEPEHVTTPQPPPPPTPPPPPPKQVGMVPPGPTIKLSGEVGWGGSRNGLEDYNFNGSGIIGGVSGQFNFPIGANTYAGLGVSVLGSGISGALPDPTTSNIWLLVPIDGVVGATFMPSGWRWPVSIYGFGGLAIGDVNISAPPFSATQFMTGWNVGVGGDVQISPNWSVGLKYRHFDLGNANLSVFPGGTSLVSERGDMVTGTLSYHFSILPPAPTAPMVTK